MGQEAVDDLVALLDLEAIEVNIFRGPSPKVQRQRVFGGQVAGQALVAAARTVPTEFTVHSLHAYFLRPGDTTVPILYEVDRIRDGRSFVTRRVVAIQHGRAIFHLQASFHLVEQGFEHQSTMPVGVPDPLSLPDFKTRWAPFAESMGEDYHRDRPIDTRNASWEPADRKRVLPPRQDVWFRADGTLPDDAVLHACVVTYASDMTLLDTATLPHAVGALEETLFMASLDHAMWFHRPFRADDWVLYVQDSPSASEGRGLARGEMFTRDGALAVSLVQEGLLRVAR
ncbi:MAG: acyl-CoA thioesterase II [Acidimicrobiales bacterium]|nr:acyl-CoA thioesterase II [Acidimicrobiales bacterium]